MTAALHVSLTSTLQRPPLIGSSAPPLLDPRGPFACLGGARGSESLVVPVQPNAISMFGPRGACLAGDALWVSDTGHHRLLGWASAPTRDDVPADWVIGQPDFTHEGRNAKGAPSSTTLNVPTGDRKSVV